MPKITFIEQLMTLMVNQLISNVITCKYQQIYQRTQLCIDYAVLQHLNKLN